MADVIQKIHDLEKLFADFVEDALGLADNQVVIQYPVKGQPAPKIGQTLIFEHITQERNELQAFKNRREIVTPGSGISGFSQTSRRMLQLAFQIYGPECDTLATKLEELFYFESTRLFLEQNNMSLVSDRSTLYNKIHEKINERWWERVDLEIYLYTNF